ncbi:patatin-like phospholipase family protein [Antrihabitans cavernicola]|uniref:Patatin-like phospholipase family protein n=1 Tax=Antrihabitans cavernicola TaxID=2495913 RepID=A0A5A7S9Y9_9NOCA|nr:patatin-like phospholipase family protein [Spelaeibacter cavernicola]KAA0021355.1 patatin-like phospholipase family protein [Spelaeibacter cavernicola]
MSAPQTALLLGGGGVGGTAWMLGLANGLAANGIDLTRAERSVGTSAGAIAAAILATGVWDLSTLGDAPAIREGAPPPVPDAEIQRALFDILGDSDASRRDKSARIADITSTLPTADDSQIRRIHTLIGTSSWPRTDLRIVSLAADTGERHVWTSESGTTLSTAVAASHAFPGAFPPVQIGRARHIDGGLFSDINADLAGPAQRVLILRPFHGVFPEIPSPDESAVLTANTTLLVGPDSESRMALDPALAASAAWSLAFAHGTRQADKAVGPIREWLGRAGNSTIQTWSREQ